MDEIFKKCISIIESGLLPKREDLASFIDVVHSNEPFQTELFKRADATRKKYYSNKVFIRGLIEYTNFCNMDCYYCGIRRSNINLDRYVMSVDEVLNCAKIGYEMGFRTFVIQGGENKRFDDDITKIVTKLKSKYPDCAITLSLGERSYETYKLWHDAGADRYLLRHESADDKHFGLLHPDSQTLSSRKKCLYDLKDIGYTVGAGMMVGSFGWSYDTLAEDIYLLKELMPQMVGIGPFLPQENTPFCDKEPGSVTLTLIMIAITRLILPSALIPATTALATAKSDGRIRGIKAGANVIMPNISPQFARDRYRLYDGKLSSGLESGEFLDELKNQISENGYEIVCDRGDYVQS